MIKSMTGYGRGEVEAPLQKWIVELKRLHHRFLDLSLGLPRHLWALEERCRKLVKGHLARGRVEMQLSYENKPGAAALHLRLDPVAAEQVRTALESLKAAAELTEPMKLEHLLRFADLLISREWEAPDGADDVKFDDETIEIIDPVDSFKEISDRLHSAGIQPEEAELRPMANNDIELGADETVQVVRMVEALEQLDDVQAVYSNLSISDEVMAQLEAA